MIGIVNMLQQYTIIKPTQACEVIEPLAIFRILSVSYSPPTSDISKWGWPTGELTTITADDKIEDPAIDYFLIVLRSHGNNEFTVYFEGQFWLAKEDDDIIGNDKYMGISHKFFDVGYVYAPYVPITTDR